MSITDTFHIEYSLPTVVNEISGAQNPEWIAYNLLKAIRDTLLAAGWTLTGSTQAKGDVYVNGWFVNYTPTHFHEIFKEGGPFLTDDNSYVTRNDQCGCAADIHLNFENPNQSGGGPIDFGVHQSACGVQCRNGCWLGATCPCGHTCCTEGDDCIVHIDTTSPSCDNSGNYCGGLFTGTFQSFCRAIVGLSRDAGYYDSSHILVDGTTDGIHASITALQGGPEWNAPFFKTAVGVGFDNGPCFSVAGGGWILKSKANPFNGTQYTLTIVQNNFGQVEITVTDAFSNFHTFKLACANELVGGRPAPYYRLIANGYQLVIVDLHNDDVGAFLTNGGNSFLVSSFWTNNTAITNHVLAIGPGQIMSSLVWNNGPVNVIFLNGSKYEQAGGTGLHFFGMIARDYSFNDSLYDSDGQQIKSNAWVFAPTGIGVEATIMGKLWSAFISSKLYPKDTVIPFDLNTSFHQICRQDARQVSSLWMTEVNLLGGDDTEFTPPPTVGTGPKKLVFQS